MGYFFSLWQSIGGRLLNLELKSSNKSFPSLVVDQCLRTKLRLVIKTLMMESNDSNVLHPSLRPPECVKGMSKLARDKFDKTVKVPGIKLPKKQISLTQKTWKPFLLKMKALKPIASLDDSDPLKDSHNLILLDPYKLECSSDDSGKLEKLCQLGFAPEDAQRYELNIRYNNWSVADIMRAVLPEDADNISSFTQIGHIAHLNLKEGNLPYKRLIGEVIVDKIPSVTTVVNKLNSIDNTYRNFEMELLAGENNFITQTKEHNCIFELDFSKVYWNSRLSTEHQRLVEFIPEASIVYDVFAGVGPFTVPLGKKKKCVVFANDLNPHSFKSLEKNIELNRVNDDLVKSYNMDGRDFIQTIVKSDLSKRIENAFEKYNSHPTEFSNFDSVHPKKFIIMNLPALAIDFIDAFDSLLADLSEKFQNPKLIDLLLPTVYCYAFCSKQVDFQTEVKKRAEEVLKKRLPCDTSVRVVRNVSPNKEMVCLTFKLQSDIVFTRKKSFERNEEDNVEPESKRPKL